MRRWLPVCAAVVIVAACHSALGPLGEPVRTAGEGVAGIVAHTESAQRHVNKAVPHADSTGKVHLAAATDEHQAILGDAAKVREALIAAHEQVASLQGTITAQAAAYDRLESRWFVTWGRRIERALWIVGITWLVLGVASIVFGLGNPLSLGWRIGKEITRLVPAMNPFSWIRDWILSHRKQETQHA